MAYADFSQPFILNVDASREGLGAVLYQNQGGLDRVIAYASRGLRPSEYNYPAHKLEFLCMKWALCDKFYDYLYGNTFTVFTDNNPLTYVTTTAKLDATSHRWLASLSNFNFKLVYKSGKSNRDADGLSRRPTEVFPDVIKALTSAVLVEREELPLAECLVLSHNAQLSNVPVDVSSATQDSEWNKINWNEEQGKDTAIHRVVELIITGLKPSSKDLQYESKEVREYVREWKNLELQKGILYRKTIQDGVSIKQLVLPSHYRDVAFKGVHNNVGHQGRDKTLW